MFDPCFGCMPLQQGVKICAFVKIAFDVIFILTSGALCLVFLLGSILVTSATTSSSCRHAAGCTGAGAVGSTIMYIVLIAFVIIFLLYIVMLVFDILLILAAGHRNLSRCKLWLIVNIVCCTLQLIFGFITFAGQLWYLGLGTSSLFWFYVYMMLVVYAFCEQIKREDAMKTPAFAAMEAAPVYGQPSQSTRVGQPPPSYHSSKASMRSQRSRP